LKLSKEILKSLIDLITELTGKGQEEISLAAGYSKTSITSILSKGVVSPKMIEKIELTFKDELKRSTYFADKSKNELSSEENNVEKTYLSERLNKKNTPTKKTIPFYDADAIGGKTDTDMIPITEPSNSIDIGDLLSDSEAAIRIFGNSMLPNYPSGCVVGLITHTDSFIIPGEIYVVETKSARLLKRLFYKDDNPESEKVTCMSDNTMVFDCGARKGKLAYPPFDVLLTEIIALYLVNGVIKRNVNSLIINKI
jgi:hypothetical protein